MQNWMPLPPLSAVYAVSLLISLLQPALAQPTAAEMEKISKVEGATLVCGDNDPFNPRITLTVSLQPGYIDKFTDDAFARRYAEYIRDTAIAACNEWLKQGKVKSVAKLFQISIRVPGAINIPMSGDGGYLSFSMLPRNGDAFSKVYETKFTNSTRDYLAALERQSNEQNRVAAAKHAEELQRQAEKQRKQTFQQKFLSDYSLTGFSSVQALQTNPFALKGRRVAIVTTFNRMIGDGEAIFDGIVVRGVPNTMFQDPRSTVLAIEVVGIEQVPALGNVSAPIAKFLGAYVCNSHSCYDVMN